MFVCYINAVCFAALKLKNNNFVVILKKYTGKIKRFLRSYFPVSAKVKAVDKNITLFKAVKMYKAIGS